MKHSIANQIYQEKYESELTRDQYYTYLKLGLSLVQHNEKGAADDVRSLKAKKIALEYNMEVMLFHLITPLHSFDMAIPA